MGGTTSRRGKTWILEDRNCLGWESEEYRDRSRSTGFQQFLPLLGTDSGDFYSLQYGKDALAEIGNTSGAARLHIMTEDIKAFTETAALIKNLDLVITVDSVIGHLAGHWARPSGISSRSFPLALGSQGRDTPWYPACVSSDRDLPVTGTKRSTGSFVNWPHVRLKMPGKPADRTHFNGGICLALFRDI